ncbi:MAG: helix-turn-helix domain-containing protein [Verrucomicrobiales bacterium]|nr:helix-turn-helix domain-containing protein [Verrucomicrobiales bacterium]
MIYQTHIPQLPLSEFIDWFWFYEGLRPVHTKERVLPQGTLELVIDLQAEPKRLYDREDYSRFQLYRRSWISGAHSQFIVIQAAENSSMMGIHFKPGGAHPFFGFPMTELKDAVVELDAVWGSRSIDLRDQLIEAPSPAEKFRILEKFLLAQARKPLQRAPAIRFALQQFRKAPEMRTIQGLAGSLGFSHRHLICEFGKWVGLTPKLFCRIRRFQQVLECIEQRRDIEWADVACGCGYYDQAHFIRDFQAFSGLNPSGYLTQRGEYLNYVPIR